MSLALTEKGVANAKADYRKDISIDNYRGLILRVEPSRGTVRRTFRLRLTLKGQQQLWTLGEYPGLKIVDVRKLHADCVHAVDHEEDPQPIIDRWHRAVIPESKGGDTGPKVRDAFEEFMVVAERERDHPDQARQLLYGNVPEDLLDTPIAALTKRHWNPVFDRIVARGSKVMANRVRDVIHRAFVVAADRDERINMIPALPKAPGGTEKARERVLDDPEIVTFWRGVTTLSTNGKRPTISRPLGIALQLLLVTGQRRGEVANARWSDITEKKAEVPGPRGKPQEIRFKVWSIPETKTDQPHAIPLSPLACRLLDELEALAEGSEYWLPSSRTGEANIERDRSITKAARRAREKLGMADWRPHDLRRTCRTGLAILGVSDAVGERVLNHGTGDRMNKVYNRHLYLLEMRTALNAWADRIEKLLKDAPK